MKVLNDKHVMCAALFTLALAAPARSQEPLPPVVEPMSLSGPRFGVTVLSDGIVNKLKADADLKVAPVVSQFGWQFEKQWATVDGGPSAVTEWVLLFGGLDQGIVLPSLSWLAGMRTRSGTEFGVGPNLTPLGVGLVIAAGMTMRAGALNIPFNVAVVPSKSGTRVSMLTGFNRRKE
jgi:hypothetical protein